MNTQPIKNSIPQSPTRGQKGIKNLCGWCGKPITEFRDLESFKEWTISGLCQTDQDTFFSETQEEVL